MFIFSPEPILLAIERRDESCKFPPPPLRGDPNKVTPSESVRKLATRIVKLQNSVTGPLRILLVGPCSTVGVGSQKEEEPFYCRHGSLSYPPPSHPSTSVVLVFGSWYICAQSAASLCQRWPSGSAVFSEETGGSNFSLVARGPHLFSGR